MSLEPETSLDLVFHALADPVRRHILQSLAVGDRRVTDLAQPFALSSSELAEHVDVLERAELVRRLPSGGADSLQLRMPPLKRAARWMAFYEEFWSTQLEELESMLAQPSRPASRRVDR